MKMKNKYTYLEYKVLRRKRKEKENGFPIETFGNDRKGAR